MLENYQDHKPELKLESYFCGEIKAWGLVKNRKRQVINRFDINMRGSWSSDTKGILQEDFCYYNGKKQQRIWHIEKTSATKYEGRADDILDKATGTLSGNTIRWFYRMDLPVGERTYRVTFDDWMFLLNDGILINKSYIKKFGLTMAEVTLFMQKL